MVDSERVLELAKVAVVFWRALRRIPEVRYSLFGPLRPVRFLGLGANHDGDRYPYFCARFTADWSASLKEEVDIMGGMMHHFPLQYGFEMPFVRCIQVGGRGMTLVHPGPATAEHPEKKDMEGTDAFLLWYDWRSPASVEALESEKARVCQSKGSHFKGFVIVTNDPWNQAAPGPLKAAAAKATNWGVEHFVLRFGNSRSLCMDSICRSVGPLPWRTLPVDFNLVGNVGVSKGGGKVKCSVM
jgi:hypothetical protein